MIEEERMKIRERNQKRRTKFILDLVQFKWGRRMMGALLSNNEDVQVLKQVIKLMLEIVIKVKDSDGFIGASRAYSEILKFLSRCNRDKRVGEVMVSVAMA